MAQIDRMAVVLAALRGGLSEPKRAMETSWPRGSWQGDLDDLAVACCARLAKAGD